MPQVALRNGKLQTVTAQEVVVGDIISLETGDVPPADGVLVQTSGDCLSLDESTLTGETESVEKCVSGDSAVYGSTNVEAGQGLMVVLCTGENSQAGQSSKLRDPKP